MRRVWLEKLNSERGALPACVGSLGQVLLCILDFIKAGVRQSHAERGEAAFGERASERE